ncbi:TPA: bifunctional aspartate kinase/homoserine dehydrogenase I [Legionella anisa]
MKIIKFGGSSLATVENISLVIQIILNSVKHKKIIVVVSAFQGVTNQLLSCARLAGEGDRQYEAIYEQIAERHLKIFKKLTQNSNPQAVQQLLAELENVLYGIYLLKNRCLHSFDLAASFGERLSALIVASSLNQYHASCYVDARKFIITDHQFTHANVQFSATNAAIVTYFKQLNGFSKKYTIPVVTGFIGTSEEQHTTTIGRNGSDYTASIIGAALDVELIEIWTDVDGIYSADPQLVSTAFILPQLTYKEALALSYFGAKVICASAIIPPMKKNIPIVIKNTLNSSAVGTLITYSPKHRDYEVSGVTSIDNITLLTLWGIEKNESSIITPKLFATLHAAQVPIFLTLQASANQAICFAIHTTDLIRTKKAIYETFHYEIEQKFLVMTEQNGQTLITAVSESINAYTSIASQLFHKLCHHNIHINAMAHGTSEQNISFVINSAQSISALNIIHRGFFDRRKQLCLIIIGTGNIGTALLNLLSRQENFFQMQKLDVKVCGIINRHHSLFNEKGIDLKNWKSLLLETSAQEDKWFIKQKIAQWGYDNIALIDCTAAQEVVNNYANFIKNNMHIITPNKKANIMPFQRYQDLLELFKQQNKHFLDSTTVGAGLPILSTLNDLKQANDKIIHIEGVFSGTLNYIFNHFNGSVPFSSILKEAYEQGYTEPDPREDLAGFDVAKKLLILMRKLGQPAELKDVQSENLVPPALCRGGFSRDFFNHCEKLNSIMAMRLSAAQENQAVLRYVGVIAKDGIYAKLAAVSQQSALATTQHTDNIIVITSHCYQQQPLIIKGPGAGPEVTAMGIFSDILKLLQYLSS